MQTLALLMDSLVLGLTGIVVLNHVVVVHSLGLECVHLHSMVACHVMVAHLRTKNATLSPAL